MSKPVDPWPEGQEAWGRLAGWYREALRAASDGDIALTALSDVGVLRRLLDQVEFEAVRAARRQGRSWSEIAIRLGVTRQSAWERWRDVDDAAPAAASSAAPSTAPSAVPLAVPTEMTARERRRRSSVTVPNVIGMSWNDARDVLFRNGLAGVSSDPDALPVTATGWPDGVVTDQSPESGATVPPGSTITLWVDRNDGGSGVREPRRPKPDPKTGRKMWDEVTDEAVG